MSFLLQETPIQAINAIVILSFAYQSIIVAFISYLVWFYLVHAHPVSRLSSFTFLTPVFATGAGVLFLQEPLTLKLILSLIFVSLGIYIVNRQ